MSSSEAISSNNWSISLETIGGVGEDASLLNPLSREELSLPDGDNTLCSCSTVVFTKDEYFFGFPFSFADDGTGM